MVKKSKRMAAIAELVATSALYPLPQAVALLQQCPPLGFDQSVEISLKTGIDAKKADQQVRGMVLLPHGSGRKRVIAVLARGEAVKKAQAAGADFVGAEELIDKVRNGWLGFDILITTPEMMREVSSLGKMLGPRGLMPTPKAGTVTADVAQATVELKAGRVAFKSDRTGLISAAVGKISFAASKLEENVHAFVAAVAKAKPTVLKKQFLQTLFLSSTMGPGLKIDLSLLTNL